MMSKEKTLEVFAEIAALLRSVRHEDPEYWQFNIVALGIISGKTLDWEEMETALIELSNYQTIDNDHHNLSHDCSGHHANSTYPGSFAASGAITNNQAKNQKQ